MNTGNGLPPTNIEIPDVGTFALKDGRYLQTVQIQNQEVSFAWFPSNKGELTDKWIRKMSLRCRRFIDRFDAQIDVIGENVRKLCREYDLYENVEIPWSNEELLADLKWHDVKFSDSPYSKIECCTEPQTGPMSNFSLIIGFDEEMVFGYVHFDG